MKRTRIKIKNRLRFGIVALVALGVVGSGLGGLLALTGFFGGSGSESSDLTRGLVGHWAMDDAGGALVRDQSGQGNDGMINDGGSGNPIAYWDFDEGTGQTATDRIGSYNGTLGSSASADTRDPVWSGGKIGGALEFNGSEDWLNVADNDAFSFGNGTTDSPFSISLWVLRTKSGSFQEMIAKMNSIANEEWVLQFNTSDKIIFNITDPSASVRASLTADNVYPANEWMHVTVTYDGTGGATAANGMTMYVNGSAVSATASNNASYVAMENKTTDVRLGSEGLAAGGSFFKGKMDDVRVYDYELAATQIQRDYAQSYKSKWVPGVAENLSTNAAGTALEFDGVDDFVGIGSAILPSTAATFSFSAWVNLNSVSVSQVIINESAAGSVKWGIWFDSTTSVFKFSVNSATNNATSSTVGAGRWYHVVGIHDDNASPKTQIFLDGVLQSTTANVNATDLTTEALFIGARSNATLPTNGTIDDPRIYNRTLSADEVRRLYNSRGPVANWKFDEGSGRYAYDSSRKSEDITSNLKGYWSINEGTGTSVADASGNSNTGTAADHETVDVNCVDGNTPPPWATGQSSNALNFDGCDDKVTVGDTASTRIPSGEITIAAWIYPERATNYILGRGYNNSNSGEYSFRTASQKVAFSYQDGAAANHTYSSNNTISLNAWHHIAISYTRADGSSMKMYIDGVLVDGSWTSGTGNELPLSCTTQCPFEIGHWYGTPAGTNDSYFFDGRIDEVYLFTRALTANQIKYLYNLQNNDGTLGDATCQPGSGACPAWSTSGSPTQGGGSLSFDGTDDYVFIDSALGITDEITMEAWVNYDGGDAGEGRSGFICNPYFAECHYGIYIDGTSRNFGVNIWLSTPGSAVTTEAIPIGEWSHIAATIDAQEIKLYINGELKEIVAVTALDIDGGSTLKIGADGNTYFSGLLDDAKIYNYVRTPDQIRLDYNAGLAAHFGGTPDLKAGLVGHWKFDEMAGTNVVDSSGKGNTGTLTNNPTWAQGNTNSRGLSGGGGAIELDGADDYVDLSPSISNLNSSVGTLSFWFKKKSGSGTGVPFSVSQTTASNNYFLVGMGSWTGGYADESLTVNFWDQGTYRIVAYVRKGEDYYADSTWHHFSWVVGTNFNKLYVDGIEQSLTYANGSASTGSYFMNITSADGLFMGKRRYSSADSVFFNGSLDDVRAYNRTLSAEEVRYLYNNNGPIAHWKLDEGSGTTAYDSAGSNDGTLTGGPTWVSGKYGSALSLVNNYTVDYDYVNGGNADMLNPHTGDFTYTFWVLKATGGSGWLEILNKANGDYSTLTQGWTIQRQAPYIRYTHTANANTVSWDGPGTVFNDGTWHQWTLVGNRTAGTVELFQDGVSQGKRSPGGSFTTADITSSSSFTFGGTTSVRALTGLMDDVKVYNYARTAEQVREDYNAGLAAKFGGTPDLQQGLVGHWKFDEMTGTSALDSSVNSNTGTLTNNPTWAQGVNTSTSYHGLSGGGGAIQFDGKNDLVTMGDPGDGSLDFGTGDLTISLWVKTTSSATMRLVNKKNTGSAAQIGYEVSMTSGVAYAAIGDGTNGTAPTGTNTFNDGEWHHVAVVFDKDTTLQYYVDLTREINSSAITSVGDISSSLTFYVGRDQTGAQYFNGTIDDVRIWNRALSLEEVRYLYNNNGPVAHWKLDENSGTTAYDSAGSNDGTLEASMTDADWVSGKYGNALDFDGTDDSVDVGDIDLQNLTLSAWVKGNSSASSTPPFRGIIYKGNAIAGQGFNYGLAGNGGGTKDRFLFFVCRSVTAAECLNSGNAITSTTVMKDDAWHHVAATFDGTTAKLYVDGAFENSAPYSYTLLQDDYPTLIGEDEFSTNRFFHGLIDDPKIYNYARSASQILEDYNAGKSIYFR